MGGMEMNEYNDGWFILLLIIEFAFVFLAMIL